MGVSALPRGREEKSMHFGVMRPSVRLELCRLTGNSPKSKDILCPEPDLRLGSRDSISKSLLELNGMT